MNFEKDTIHRYVGFHGAESKCHIRILDYEESKPIVVVCTQIPENKGTSVTNVAENLAQEIKQQLKEKNPSVVKELTQYVKEAGCSKILGDAIKQVKRQESDGNLVFML